MAIRTNEYWAYNPNIGTEPKWVKYSMQILLSDFAWFDVVVFPFTSQSPVMVDGVSQQPMNVWFVGEFATPPGTPVHTKTYTYESGNEVDGELISGDLQETSTYNGYAIVQLDTGATRRGCYNPDYIFESRAELLAALDQHEIDPVYDTKVYFDVYIDGTNKPSIFVNWTAGEDLSPAELTPKVWNAVQSLLPTYDDIITKDGINQPNELAWQLESAGSFSYAGSYENTYLSIQQEFSKYLNTANKIVQWGINMEPEFIRLYLRMDTEVNGIGDLYRVEIEKDGTATATKIEDSSTTGAFTTIVRLHTGEPDYIPPQDPDTYPSGENYGGDGPGQYDPDDKPDPTDFTEPGGFDGNAVLTKTYAVSDTDLRNIGQKLWSQDYFNVLKIQNNPIENIIAVKHFPFAMPSGTTEEIKIGDVAFGVNGDKVASVQSYRTKATLKIGSYTFTAKYKNYLDLAPYTSIKLFLPYIGFIQLDPAEVYGSKITVFYYVDLVTGQCMVRIVLDEQTIEGQNYSIPYMTVYGQMGVDIPLTSSDRVQTELRTASAALTAVGGSAGQMVSGNIPGGVVSGLSDALSIAGADYTSQRTSSQSPSCSSFDCQDVFVMITRPAAEYVDRDAKTGYGHLHGYPCHKYKRLSDSVFKDGHFVQIERRTDLKIAATSEENRMLEELLTSGVYI